MLKQLFSTVHAHLFVKILHLKHFGNEFKHLITCMTLTGQMWTETLKWTTNWTNQIYRYYRILFNNPPPATADSCLKMELRLCPLQNGSKKLNILKSIINTAHVPKYISWHRVLNLHLALFMMCQVSDYQEEMYFINI